MKKIIFKDDEHERFYKLMITETNSEADVYRKSFFYAIGICSETRKYNNRLYDFEENGIRIEGLSEPWQTSGTMQICRLAFNLYNGFHYTGDDWDRIVPDSDGLFAPYDLFRNPDAIYMVEAVKLRFPEYFREQ